MKVERKHIFVIGVILIIVFHVLLFIPAIPVAESSPSRTYNTEPNDRPATYEVVSTELVEMWSDGGGRHVHSEIVLNNTDSHGGVFKVTFCFFNQSLDAKTGKAYHFDGGIDRMYEFSDWKFSHDKDALIGILNIDGGISLLILTVDFVTTEIFVESGETRVCSASLDAQSIQEVNFGYTVFPPRIRTVYKSILELLITR